MLLQEYITDIAAGPFGSNLKVSCFVEKGFPIIDGANLKGYKVTDNITKFVTEEKARSLHRSIAKRGDIVVTISGNVGQISYIPDDSEYEEYLVSQRQFRATFDRDKVNVAFLVYYFHTREGQHKILSFANQVGVPALAQPLKNFKNISIELPSKDRQDAIAAYFDNIEDKIAINRRICKNLEAQAQALFKHWFIDFAPFKDGKFVESDLGMIPEGWKLGTLSDLIELKYGKDHKKLKEGNIPAYGSAGLMRYVDNYLYQGESVLIPRKGTLNNVMLVDEAFWTVDTMFYTIPKQTHVLKYVYLKLSRIDFTKLNVGTSIPSNSTVQLNKINVIIPPSNVLMEFDDLLENIIKMKRHLIKEAASLSKLRDTLLPKLMSGQIKL